MRSMLVVLFAAVSVTGNLGAQSLEESYAKLCPQPAKAGDEACLALKQALIVKRGQEKSTASASKTSEVTSDVMDQTWGPLAQLVNTAWAVETPGFNIIDRFTWAEEGAAVRYTGQLTGAAHATTEIIFRPGPEPGILSAVVQFMGNKSEVLFRFKEGILVSDFYFTDTTSRHGPTTHRHEFSLTDSGQYLARNVVDLTGGRPDFPHFYGQFTRYSDDGIAQLKAQGQEKAAMIDRMVKAKDAADAQAAKAAKAERSAERAAVFGAVMQGLAQGAAEVDTGGYAEALANLDATVANIQYAAAAERQQQDSSQQASQQPARASQSQQMQVAPSSSSSPSPASQYIEGQDVANPSAGPAPGGPVQRESGAVPGKQLRFVLMISMRNLPGDKVNSTCYSNVVTRDGPPGWGSPGFLPPGSAEQARETVYDLKSAFIAQCRASGREITSDGNFNFQLNQVQGDEERLQGMRARYSEDVSVSL